MYALLACPTLDFVDFALRSGLATCAYLELQLSRPRVGLDSCK